VGATLGAMDPWALLSPLADGTGDASPTNVQPPATSASANTSASTRRQLRVVSVVTAPPP
jgi:hypothetical protein